VREYIFITIPTLSQVVTLITLQFLITIVMYKF